MVPKLKKVNPYFLDVLLEPITGLADDDEAVVKYSPVDLNDEVQARAIIRKLMVPHALELTPKMREKTQLAYRYYLSRDSTRWDYVFDSILPPFRSPENYRLFMYWLYEECFQTSDYELPEIEQYVVDSDINEPLAVWVKEKRERDENQSQATDL